MRTVVRIVAALVVATIAVGAQPKKPNFSGTWTVISPKASAGQVEIVTQDDKANTLTTEHASEAGGHKMTYQLDGVQRRLAIPARTDITMLAAASWDGDHIVITTNISYPNGMKTQSKEVWSIDEKGQRVVDYTESGPPGPGPSQKVVYVKK